ncbi:MAG: hypothetical protein SFT93_02345, partial [Rickettsiaceae bacterium]|nr:hypothetical protein [Rickettsiaceae bacterium]
MKINLNLIPLLGLAQSSANTHQKFKDQDFKPLSNINLASLTSSQGFWINGINNNDRTAYAVRSAGDVNGDGYSDMIIGAQGYPSGSYTGRAYVVYGGSALSNINLGSLTSSQGFTVDGINTNDNTGVSVSSAGDINNDGYVDMIIGAHSYPSGSHIGRAYVIYGGSSLSNINLASLTSSQGFTVDGINTNDHTGVSVSSAGDVNKDGYSDMIIGAVAYPSGSSTGRAYVIYGGPSLSSINLASLTSSQGFTVDGINNNDGTGSSVSSAGDVNKDGYADMIIAAASYPSGSSTGRAYVIYGGPSLSSINLASLTSSQGFTVDGINNKDGTGYCVSSAGDVNKDGYSDMIIGAWGYPSDLATGRAYVIYGNASLTNINLGALTLSQGFWVQGINNYDYTGASVGSAGDINKDGYSDMIIGAWGYPSGSYTGRAYVIYGGASLNNINLASITSSQGFTVDGINTNDQIALSVSSAGDINKDGYSDMIIGARGYPSGSYVGRAYVIYGGSTINSTLAPSISPSSGPTLGPTTSPTLVPTHSPTTNPSSGPTVAPVLAPTTSPTAYPTLVPTHNPTTSPSFTPTLSPTASPALMPTPPPSTSPSSLPTLVPTAGPTVAPSQYFVITCNSGQATCVGTSLNDHFFIKTLNNVLVTGYGGNDLFSIYQNTNSNSIIITDFNLNGEIDLIDLSDFSYSFADLSTKYNRITNEVTIFLPDGQTIILQNQNSDITKADFTGLVAASPTLAPIKSTGGESNVNIVAIASSLAGASSAALLACFSKSLCISAFDKWHPGIPEALPGFNFVNMILYPCSLIYKKAYVDETHLRLEIVSRRLNVHRSNDNDDQLPDAEVLMVDNNPINVRPTTTLLVDTIKFDNPLLNDIYHSKYSKSESISLLRDFNQNSVSQNIVSQNSGMSES